MIAINAALVNAFSDQNRQRCLCNEWPYSECFISGRAVTQSRMAILPSHKTELPKSDVTQSDSVMHITVHRHKLCALGAHV